MSKFQVLVKQLYKQKIRSKSFVLMTLLYLVLMIAVTFWSDIRDLLFSDEVVTIAVINDTAYPMEPLFVDDDKLDWKFLGEVSDTELESNKYLATIFLTDNAGKLEATLTSFDPLELNMQQNIAQHISTVGQLYVVGQLNLNEQQTALLLDSEPTMTVNTLNTAGQDGKSADEKQAGILVAYFIGFLIYFFITTFLSMITTDVASEKGSRALEMLLVSVKPGTHFRAKLTGVFLLALTQFVILFGAVFALLKFTDDGAKWSFVTEVIEDLSISYFFYVIVFVVLTLFLYLIVGALFGSLVSKVEEAGQVMMPAMIVTILGFYVMISGMSNPDTMLIKVFSYIPFTSGMVMPMRLGATDMSMIELFLSLGVLIIAVVVLYTLSISFYKRSVLTYTSGGIMQKIKTVFKVTT